MSKTYSPDCRKTYIRSGFLLPTLLALALTACGDEARLPVSAGTGPHPQLPTPNPPLVPTVNVAPAKGWPENAKPVAMQSMKVNAFAKGLTHPRWLYVLPNGDVLVAETSAPSKPEDDKPEGIRDWIMSRLMHEAGAREPSPNRITLLRDNDGDGVAETRTKFIEGLNSPFGMALIGNDFYIANTDAVVKFSYTPGAERITQPGTKIADLPAGPINYHWTKNLLASRDGTKLYVTVGSNSNIGENGLDEESGRAAIWEIDPKQKTSRLFASGLRNPCGLDWQPDSGALWTVVNERDELGGDLVPDYLTEVPDGSFFGWPYSYFGQHIDERVKPQQPDLVAKARVPDYGLGSHTASLGLTFVNNNAWPAPFNNGAFIGQHGSWNRKPFSGYRVVFVSFKDGKPSGDLFEVLTGFLSRDGNAFGRPVGVALDKHSALLVADDVGNTVWRVVPASAPAPH